MRVLDIATGTGLCAEAALAAVGPTGHVTAADISPAMVAKARERLGDTPNVSLSVEDGQALPFPDESFDAVLCNLGLMFFPPVRGLGNFAAYVREHLVVQRRRLIPKGRFLRHPRFLSLASTACTAPRRARDGFGQYRGRALV